MNRINAQVLSGLTEGEMVVIGTRTPSRRRPRREQRQGR
jgi:hypothetical protein